MWRVYYYLLASEVNPSSTGEEPSYFSPSNSMSVSGIHGQLLEITVVGCNKLRNTEWISRQNPYVCLDYASSKNRTRTCYGGGKNPTFQDKFDIALIEGLLEINITVWNSNKLTFDDFIGNGKVPLQGVLFQGYVDSCWPLLDRKGRNAGEVRLVMHYPNANKLTTTTTTTYVPSAPPYAATPHHPAHYSAAPPLYSSHPPVMANYPPVPVPHPCPQPVQYHHQPSPYHPAYQASPSYTRQPSYPRQSSYPPAVPNPYYPQDHPPPHPQHHTF